MPDIRPMVPEIVMTCLALAILMLDLDQEKGNNHVAEHKRQPLSDSQPSGHPVKSFQACSWQTAQHLL